MKKNKLWIKNLGILAMGLVLFLTQASASNAYGYGWNVNSFDADIRIQEDGYITVTETIVADYRDEEHHGIIRSIPVDYRDRYGNRLSLYFEVISINDENGNPWRYEKYRSGDILNLKIGDPDVYLNDLSTFKITYKVGRAINRFDTYDELYWNATGSQWEAEMKDVHATITLPESVKEEDIKAACYTGSYGSTEQDCSYDISNHTVTYEVNDKSLGMPDLYPYNGLTIVVGFPKGTVAAPTIIQQALWFFADNWGYGLPAVTFSVLYYVWFTRGRDPKAEKNTIMPIYKAPKGLTPTEAGTIIDEHLDMHDISSSIVDMAVRGYLQIIESKEKKILFSSTDYTFKKLKEFKSSELKAHEIKLLNALFSGGDSIKLSDLKYKFYKSLPGIRSSVYSGLIKDGYFPTDPEKVRNVYYTIGGVLVGVVLFFLGVWIEFLPLSAILGVVVSGVLFLIFARFMPAKTKKGVDMYYQIKGLEEFIRTAERDRIKWQEQENIFEALLPFAMTLGLATKWAQTFEGVYKTAPSWYVGTDPLWHRHFNTVAFTNNLNSVASEMQRTFASSPRSSSGGGSGFSGGFSGGGFGGGGGSSW